MVDRKNLSRLKVIFCHWERFLSQLAALSGFLVADVAPTECMCECQHRCTDIILDIRWNYSGTRKKPSKKNKINIYKKQKKQNSPKKKGKQKNLASSTDCCFIAVDLQHLRGSGATNQRQAFSVVCNIRKKGRFVVVHHFTHTFWEQEQTNWGWMHYLEVDSASSLHAGWN